MSEAVERALQDGIDQRKRNIEFIEAQIRKAEGQRDERQRAIDRNAAELAEERLALAELERAADGAAWLSRLTY